MTERAYRTIAVDRPAANVMRLLVARPDKLNAIDHDVREEMYHALVAALADKSVRALVLGGVEGNLSAGGDLPSMIGLSEDQARARLAHIHRLCKYLSEAPIPVVTAAQGWAAGASVGLAMLGDYIVVGAGTRFVVPFFKLGLVPDWGMLRTLPARVGLGKARQIIFESRTLGGTEAVDIGLADILADDDAVMERAVSVAADLARLPGGAMAKVKARLLSPASSLAEDLRCEEADQVALLQSAEFAEGHAAFMAKRPPDFVGTNS